MGINLEYATLLAELQKDNPLNNRKILEFGAQEIGAPVSLASHLSRYFPAIPSSIETAAQFYAFLGYTYYVSIDATAENGALPYDLNLDIRDKFNFYEEFDLVTNLGTFEHVFNVASAFVNMHNFCKKNGLMIHALTSSGNVNHGYYNIHPRMLADLCAANEYEIVKLLFTVDYLPTLFEYNLENYKAYDDRDILIYAVLKKTTEQPFKVPFDSIFSEKNTLHGYRGLLHTQDFAAYIKDSWANTRPSSLDTVPATSGVKPSRRRFMIKRIIDKLGKLK